MTCQNLVVALHNVRAKNRDIQNHRDLMSELGDVRMATCGPLCAAGRLPAFAEI